MSMNVELWVTKIKSCKHTEKKAENSNEHLEPHFLVIAMLYKIPHLKAMSAIFLPVCRYAKSLFETEV